MRSAPWASLVGENCLDRPGGPHREEALMALVICDMSTSLDGYVTGPNDSRENPFGDGAGMLHNWMFDAATDQDRAILQEMLDGVGAIVMGRKSFDKNEGDGGWGDAGPVGDTPCFVVTHNKPAASYPPVYTFVTDGVASAIEQAKHVAGEKVVGLHGATVMQQALPLGLVDELRVHLIRSCWEAARRCSARWTRRSPSNARMRW
jgi:dihydrofolate reductase